VDPLEDLGDRHGRLEGHASSSGSWIAAQVRWLAAIVSFEELNLATRVFSDPPEQCK